MAGSSGEESFVSGRAAWQCTQEEAQAAESQNSALQLARAERYAAEFELLQDTFACGRACFCRAGDLA